MTDHAEARELYEYAVEADRKNRDEALEDLRFRAGEQWPDQERQAREAAHRPCLTINTLGQYVRRVTGEARQNPPAIQVIPIDDSDESGKDAQLREGLIRHIEQRSRAKTAYIGALESAVACGIGHLRLSTEVNDLDPLNQDIRISHISDPLSVVYDPDAMDPLRTDGMYCFVTGVMSERAFRRRYPKADATEWEREGAHMSRFWEMNDRIRVVEMFRRVKERRKILLMSDGARVDATGMGKRKLQELVDLAAAMDIAVIREAEYDAFNVMRSVLSGRDFLEKETEFPSRYIPIIPVVGEEHHIGEARVRHGMVRFARDPQRLYNYWRTAAAEMVALAPKAPFMATATQIGPFKQMWDQANKSPTPYLLYQADPDAPTAIPARATAIEPPSAMWQEASVARDDMKAVTGIYDASLGAGGNETSGRAIMARQREGDIGSFIYIDNLRRAIEHTGRIILDMIPRIYDAERVISILGDDGSAEPAVINRALADGSIENDMTAGRWDVRISTGPSYESKRQETAEAMLQLVQAFPQIMAIGGDILVSNLDFPRADELAERMQEAMQPQQQTQEPQGTPGDQAKAIKDFASAAKTEAETEAVALQNLASRIALGVR